MPGFQLPGELWQCHHGTADPLQPYGDAFDCMELEDRVVVNRIYVAYAKAVAAFEYTLLSVDSPFDRWVREGPTSTAIHLRARRGAALFVGKAACVECHEGPMLTDQLFHNVGVPQVGETLSPYVPSVADCPEGAFCDCVSDDTSRPRFCFPNGHRDGLRLLQDTVFRRDSVFSDDDECQAHRRNHIDRVYADANPDQCNGVIRYYPYPFDRMTIGQWRTPTLRNVELTGPYMHNGMYTTLDQVIEHYDTGAEEFLGLIEGELDEDVGPLHLTPDERADLVSFMESLTGAPLDPSISGEPALPPRSPFPEASPFRD
jgi:cytochrome c peroxidase